MIKFSIYLKEVSYDPSPKEKKSETKQKIQELEQLQLKQFINLIKDNKSIKVLDLLNLEIKLEIKEDIKEEFMELMRKMDMVQTIDEQL